MVSTQSYVMLLCGLVLLLSAMCPAALLSSTPLAALPIPAAPPLVALVVLGLTAIVNLPGFRPWLIHQLVEYRAVVLVCFACPVSVLVWLLNAARNSYAEATVRPEDHERRVEQVSAQVRSWAESPAETRRPMCTARASWQNLSTRFVDKDVLHKIELSHLRDVLSVDAAQGKKGTVLVEPNVTVGLICRKLAPTHMLAVCLELEVRCASGYCGGSAPVCGAHSAGSPTNRAAVCPQDATLGGLAMGVGMTTASHIYGLYQETIVSMKVVVGDGSVIHATRTNEHAALFKCLPWSHGSLGFLVELELMVVPTQPFVKLTYTPTFSQAECCELVRSLANASDPPDFVEATVFDRKHAVVMAGVFVSPRPAAACGF